MVFDWLRSKLATQEKIKKLPIPAFEMSQSDWTHRRDSIVKQWNISGLLQDGRELTVQIDITFSKSIIPGDINAFSYVKLKPNGLTSSERLVKLKILPIETDSSGIDFVDARATSCPDGSVLISTLDRYGSENILAVMSQMKTFKLFVQVNDEIVTELTLPNNLNDFGEIAKLAMLVAS
jgi:hypothetical protein